MNFKVFSMALAAIASQALFAQVSSPAPSSPTKVGVIHIQQAVLSTKDGQKAAQELQAKFDPRRKEIDKRNSEIQQLQDQFRKTQNTASEDQRTKLARDIDQKQKSLQRDMEDAQSEVEQEQGRVFNELGGRLMQVIDKYARDNAYTLILDVSSQQTAVLYFANGTDVTAEVIKLYDANAPAAKPPTGGAAPGTTAPVPTLPRPSSQPSVVKPPPSTAPKTTPAKP